MRERFLRITLREVALARELAAIFQRNRQYSKMANPDQGLQSPLKAESGEAYAAHFEHLDGEGGKLFAAHELAAENVPPEMTDPREYDVELEALGALFLVEFSHHSGRAASDPRDLMLSYNPVPAL